MLTQTRRIAFEAGIYRLCKEAGLDAADHAEVQRLLFLPPAKAVPIIIRAEVDRREELVKKAGDGLIKLSGPSWFGRMKDRGMGMIDDMLAKFKQPFEGKEQGTTTLPDTNADASALSDTEASEGDQEVEGGGDASAMKTDPTTATTSDGEAAQNAATQASNEAGGKPVEPVVTDSAGAAEDGVLELEPTGQSGQTGQTGGSGALADMSGVWNELSPQVRAQYGTPEAFAKAQQDMQDFNTTKTTAREGMRGWGVNAMGARHGSGKWQNMNPNAAGLPEGARHALALGKSHWQQAEAIQRAAMGDRSGWAMRGSSMKGGPQGITPVRGRGVGPTAQQAASNQASTAAAGGAQQPIQPPPKTGVATFNMQEGTGASAAGQMPVVGGAKPWRASGSTDAFDGDTSRSLSVNYPGTAPQQAAAAAPAPEPVSPTRSDALDGARPMQEQVNTQMAQDSGMATPTAAPQLAAEDPYKMETPQAMQNVTTGTVNPAAPMGGMGFGKGTASQAKTVASAPGTSGSKKTTVPG